MSKRAKLKPTVDELLKTRQDTPLRVKNRGGAAGGRAYAHASSRALDKILETTAGPEGLSFFAGLNSRNLGRSQWTLLYLAPAFCSKASPEERTADDFHFFYCSALDD